MGGYGLTFYPIVKEADSEPSRFDHNPSPHT